MSRDNDERAVDAKEMATILSWSTDGVYRGVREGWLPALHLGPRLLRFNPDEVKSALKQKGNER